MIKYIERQCKHHGLTSFVHETRGYYRCKQCRVDSVTKKRRTIKIKAVEYKGGKCIQCGYNKCVGALQFHHTNNNKEFAISQKGATRSWEKVRAELDKCILLCANCHAEEHYI